jgi:hypothetical protein
MPAFLVYLNCQLFRIERNPVGAYIEISIQNMWLLKSKFTKDSLLSIIDLGKEKEMRQFSRVSLVSYKFFPF